MAHGWGWAGVYSVGLMPFGKADRTLSCLMSASMTSSGSVSRAVTCALTVLTRLWRPLSVCPTFSIAGMTEPNSSVFFANDRPCSPYSTPEIQSSGFACGKQQEGEGAKLEVHKNMSAKMR